MSRRRRSAPSPRPSGRVLILLALSGALAAGCGDDAGSGGAGAAGGGGGAGGGGEGGADPFAPQTYLDLASYDCRAEGTLPEPGPRPHAPSCLLDPGCTSRFVCAHRMGSGLGPENTLSALRGSILLGVDVAETDVRLTKDGHVVLLHDAEIDRTLEGSGPVGDYTLAELEAMPLKPDPLDAVEGDWSCENITTLEEAMALGEGRIVIELETKDLEAGVKSAEYLRDNDLYADAYLQCTPDECDAIRAAVPDVPIMVRVTDEATLARAEAYDPPPLLVELTADPEQATPENVARVHALGAKAFTDVFTSGDALALIGDFDLAKEKYESWYDAGFDVLQTEFPHVLLSFLGRVEARP